MRFDDVGDQSLCFEPGGRSPVTTGMPGVTNPSHFSGLSRVVTAVIGSSLLFPRFDRKRLAIAAVSGRPGPGPILRLLRSSPPAGQLETFNHPARPYHFDEMYKRPVGFRVSRIYFRSLTIHAGWIRK